MKGPTVVIIGGGIVGLATAYRLMESLPEVQITVLEKEDRVAAHQTGRNSGVIHSGLYYRPGSLKAICCRQGRAALIRFCEAEAIPYEPCGKVIVAVEEAERSRLQALYERGQQNGVACTLIPPERLRELEPHAQGVAALHVPEAGIVSYRAVAERLQEKLVAAGHRVVFQAPVQRIVPDGRGVVLETPVGTFRADVAVNCAGLYADRIAQMDGLEPGVRIVPFRGEYYELRPERRYLCRHLIYPVPDPAYPFLGVHFTRLIDGRVVCGPSAVLAFAREGYRLTDVSLSELLEMLAYPGCRRLVRRHWRKGFQELLQSLSKRYYLRQARRLIPEVASEDFLPAPSGVRAQAVDREGRLVDDFLVLESPRMVHVVNAPSPAATSAFSIGVLVARQVQARFD
ncbi:L-2-hydroxyglutarate oxidase [Rhodothermus profundi]|uniref:L-2-hydroxyglutarate oxidase n=1 Tax=Rhodothermus profundi TaxID=633813 RepID=A0A1M6TKD0_9BACT|nr:L-2-hydroxyglutarate oxidase [Rhodothermus profundi]SHK57349.1 L-2-hydroxyglutarate oxidase [Rhodothermus profundi]